MTATGGAVSLVVCGDGAGKTKTGCVDGEDYFHGDKNHKMWLISDAQPEGIEGSFVVEPWIVNAQLKDLGGGEFDVNLSGCRYPRTKDFRNDYSLKFHGQGDTPTPTGFSGQFWVDPNTCKGSKRVGPGLVEGEYAFDLQTWGDNIPQWRSTFTINEGGLVTKLEKDKDPDGKAPSQGGGSGTPGENPCGEPGGQCDTAIGLISSNGTEFISKVLTISLGIAGAIALILMVIGSIRVLTSSGDQQRLNGGREMIIAAVAGLLFLVFSVLILQFIDARLITQDIFQ